MYLLITKYMLQRGGICRFCNVTTCTKCIINIRVTKTLNKQAKPALFFIKMVIRFPSALHSTLASAWLGFGIA
jgi:hypothetical protein